MRYSCPSVLPASIEPDIHGRRVIIAVARCAGRSGFERDVEASKPTLSVVSIEFGPTAEFPLSEDG